MSEVEDFIKSRFNNDCHWLDGNCYYFALILTHRFPYLKIYYDPIDGHFLAGTPSKYYDWTGQVIPISLPILLDEIKVKDPLWYNRLVRDCIN